MPGGGSQPAGNTTTVQKADPWVGQQPYLKQTFSGAQNLYENYTPGYYPNSTNAPMNEWQGNALQGIYGRGIGGSAVDAAAQGQAQDTLGGEYLSAGNPYFDQMQQSMANKIIPQVMSQFAESGRYGSGAAANALASALADKTGQLAYQNYGDERARQMQTMSMSPSISGTDFTNLNAAGMAGAQLQGQQQQALNADKSRYDFYQNQPWDQLQKYAAVTNGPVAGGTSQTTQPYFQNDTANTMGLLSGLGSLGYLGYLAFSDRRLKDDIKKVGEADNGLPIYSYRYKGSPTTILGFMADEVKDVHPEAVHNVGGLLAVDYARAAT
jgi:hypothetical protein